MQQKTSLERTINGFNKTMNTLEEASMLFEMGMEESDQDSKLEAVTEIDKVQKDVEVFELAQMLGGETDAESAFLDINSGSGGTEAQDWAEILLRMYLRWEERKGFKTE